MNQLFNDPLFNMTAITGGIFFAAGLFMLKFPPKKINFLYGYRTNSSMKNQERWDFAQKYAAKEMMITGLVLAASGALGFVTDFGSSVKLWVGVAMLGLAVVILKLRVEKAIKKRFE
ncbi:SdpI family protein [Chryseobacterium sp. HSC-36S06]|uniref:SdpI family protein n=1 Tax=Chryseobacterium sp. HSC-36S06 TaxID=2910970 RepID=UPI00209EB032|nr:SdpI family protein [Chryseobacterium sp. HSC-36S06]MCP2037872.1 putative membrane protein [Chryseobacterium sp. HSC-36S06]